MPLTPVGFGLLYHGLQQGEGQSWEVGEVDKPGDMVMTIFLILASPFIFDALEAIVR